MSYNLEKIHALSEGDQDFVQAVVIAFVEEVPEDLKMLEKAVSTSEFDMIYQMSHKLKPNLDLLGMKRAYDYNLQLLDWAKAKTDIDKITNVFEKMNSTLHDTMKALKKEFNL